jgi:diguanylate cyclase (GGDEF)-like protein
MSTARFFQSMIRAHLGAAAIVDGEGRVVVSNQDARTQLGVRAGTKFSACCNDPAQAESDLAFSAGSTANYVFAVDFLAHETVAVFGSRLMPEPIDMKQTWVLLRFDTQANLAANFEVQSDRVERLNRRLRDETKRRRALEAANASLEQEMHRDSKTLLLTHEGLERALKDHVARPNAAPLAMIYLDLNDFKKINDTYGHGAGDVAIVEVGRIIRSNLRRGDLAARLGGDEFAIVLVGPQDRNEVGLFVARLHDLMAVPILYRDPTTGDAHPIQLSFSAGVAQYPADTKDISLLATFADQAMYRAKGRGIPTGIYIRRQG